MTDGMPLERRLADLEFGPLRAHQETALRVFEQHVDRSRFHIVMPPGAGKTLRGAVMASRVGRRVLVLVPNTATASQWQRLWETAGSVSVGTDRTLDSDVTVLTYQALATFDDESVAESAMARLHPNARDFMDRLHGGDPCTLVLDEAHHLAQA